MIGNVPGCFCINIYESMNMYTVYFIYRYHSTSVACYNWWPCHCGPMSMLGTRCDMSEAPSIVYVYTHTHLFCLWVEQHFFHPTKALAHKHDYMQAILGGNINLNKRPAGLDAQLKLVLFHVLKAYLLYFYH